jgi:alkylation response protein AidB-like acyl-CoA dehydrogenase
MAGGHPKLTARGGPEMRVGFFPAAAASIEDTWHVAGLAGTGSADIRVTELTVPAGRTAVLYSAPSYQAGPLYQLSPYNVLMVLFAGFPLGVARRALDEYIQIASARRRTGGQGVLLEDPLVCTEVVADEALLHAAGQAVRTRAAEVWETVSSGHELTLRQRAALGAATIHAFDVGRDIVTRAFHGAGSVALFEDCPLQRCLRDMHAAQQHIAFSAEARERLSRAWLGLPVPPALFAV